ncbi:MAG: hypothetical protein CL910_11435 [Deltaproteobacteria bacterium]|nr:hypothetical protein [Deltaproteobacteria bacterium]
MSQVARVFVVLNMLIAAGFLFAAATFNALNNDYMNKWDKEKKGREADITRKDLEIGKRDADIKRLESQNRALEEQRGTLTGARDALNQQVESLTSQMKTKDAEYAKLQTTNTAHATNVASLRTDLNSTRDENTKLADEARAKAKEAKDATEARDVAAKEIETLKGTIHERDKTINKKLEEISKLSLQVAYAVSKGIVLEDITPMKAMSGFVVNADNSMRLVQVNLGSKDGMKRGYMMDIVRGDGYIARVRIDTVFENQSAGLVVIPQGESKVMVGDRVTNRLQ